MNTKKEDEFTPPISERSTIELLEIVGSEKKWNTNAISLANIELKNRDVEKTKISTAKYLSSKKEKIEINNKANESYNISDFILEPFGTLLEIIVSWELRKDGLIKKAEQQKKLRIIIFIITVLLIIIANWQKF